MAKLEATAKPKKGFFAQVKNAFKKIIPQAFKKDKPEAQKDFIVGEGNVSGGQFAASYEAPKQSDYEQPQLSSQYFGYGFSKQPSQNFDYEAPQPSVSKRDNHIKNYAPNNEDSYHYKSNEQFYSPMPVILDDKNEEDSPYQNPYMVIPSAPVTPQRPNRPQNFDSPSSPQYAHIGTPSPRDPQKHTYQKLNPHSPLYIQPYSHNQADHYEGNFSSDEDGNGYVAPNPYTPKSKLAKSLNSNFNDIFLESSQYQDTSFASPHNEISGHAPYFPTSPMSPSSLGKFSADSYWDLSALGVSSIIGTPQHSDNSSLLQSFYLDEGSDPHKLFVDDGQFEQDGEVFGFPKKEIEESEYVYYVPQAPNAELAAVSHAAANTSKRSKEYYF